MSNRFGYHTEKTVIDGWVSGRVSNCKSGWSMTGRIKMKIKSNKGRDRRGLSTIVGAVFMVLLMAGALNVVLWALKQQDTVSQTIIQAQNSRVAKLNEKISFANVQVNNNKFNLTVSNSGGSVAHLVSLYVVNSTASPKQEYIYNINYYVSGRNSTTNIGQSLPLVVQSSNKYTVKVVTDGGNSATTTVSPISSLVMSMSLIAIPPTIAPGANATLLLAVTNNSTSPLTQLVSASVKPSCSGTCTLTLQSSQGNNTLLSSGQTIFFKWKYNIGGSDGSSVTFTASIVNGNPGNTATATVQIRLLASSYASSSDYTSTVVDKYVQKPEIYMTMPSPFGIPSRSSDQALWGVTVVNPTDKIMNVSRVVIQTYQTTATGNAAIFSSGCSLTAVSPTNGTWSCPTDNTVEWKKTLSPANPMKIGARSAFSFLVLVPPGSLSQISQLPSLPITATVFTSVGEFAKTGYSSNMASNSAMPNIYVSNTANSTSSAQMIGNYINVSPGASITLNVVLADMDTSTTYSINSGTLVNINIPPDFTNISVSNNHGGFGTPTITQFADGSYLVSATVTTTKLDGKNSPPGDLAAITLPITMTAPSTLTSNKVYVIYITTDGVVNNPSNFGIGAIAEFPIQVNHS